MCALPTVNIQTIYPKAIRLGVCLVAFLNSVVHDRRRESRRARPCQNLR